MSTWNAPSLGRTFSNVVRVGLWDDPSPGVHPVLVVINPGGPGSSGAPVLGGALPAGLVPGDKPYSSEFSLTDAEEVGVYIRVDDPGSSPLLSKLYLRYQVSASTRVPTSSTTWSSLMVDDIDSTTGISKSIPYTVEIENPYHGASTTHVLRFPADFGQWGRIFLWGDSDTGAVFSAATAPIVHVYVYRK